MDIFFTSGPHLPTPWPTRQTGLCIEELRKQVEVEVEVYNEQAMVVGLVHKMKAKAQASNQNK